MLELIVKDNNIIQTQNNFDAKVLNDFIKYLDIDNATTIKGYVICLRQFFKYLKDNNITKPDAETIKQYKFYLNEYKSIKNNTYLTNGTKQQYLRAVKQFFKYTSDAGLYPNIADSTRNFKLKRDINHRTSKEAFNEDDIKTILNRIDRTTETGKRDYAIILLAITGGLRINEIRNIDTKDIEIIKGQYRVNILGKGHTAKDNYIKLIPAVMYAINDYLSVKKVKTDALFTSTSNRALNKRITKESLSQIIKNRFRDAGYDSNKFTAHSLRHTSITILLNSGADIFTAQLHARHQDPKTTEIYAHINERDNNTTEQDIYNQIFNTTEQNNIINVIKNSLGTLNLDQQRLILDYMQQIRCNA